MSVHQPTILFVDAYDSFTNNIISLLSTTLFCAVRVIHIDTPGLETDEALCNELRNYDAVVCGPGPGDPLNSSDIGLMKRIWKLTEYNGLLPVLGICLGFQSLAAEYGTGIRKLRPGLHGMVRRVKHIGEARAVDGVRKDAGIFDGVGRIEATLYHSLCVAMTDNAEGYDEWSPKLRPLAWVADDASNRRILMGVQHTEKPFWGLQYHPESICTNSESTRVIQNWFKSAQQWNAQQNRKPLRDACTIGHLPQRQSLLSIAWQASTQSESKPAPTLELAYYGHRALLSLDNHLEYRTIDLPSSLSAAAIAEEFNARNSSIRDHILFESSNSTVPHTSGTDVRGRYSIIALDLEETIRFEYQTGHDSYRLSLPPMKTGGPRVVVSIKLAPQQSIWGVLSDFAEERLLKAGNPDTPFWGGFMGYTSYELGLESIDVQQKRKQERSAEQSFRPDLCFAWVVSSFVVDHRTEKIHVQNLTKSTSPTEWLDITTHRLLMILSKSINNPSTWVSEPVPTHSVALASSTAYEAKVARCQDYIADGNSYELCLTDQTHVQLPRRDGFANDANYKSVGNIKGSPWAMYRNLRASQPAPMASYIRMGTATFISASPERFLKWDEHGECELRPMKGTVKKTDEIKTLAQAEALLQIPKEQAENLMIVDLVRHDLHGVCGAGNVTVPKLMVVEEYASVFQMITVVKGQLPVVDTNSQQSQEEAQKTRYTGIDVLAASLPPGSMTGAPKKRSCEILQEIEDGYNRSLYSGVVGYMDIGGRGDFSVNIRCLFRWDDEYVASGQGDIKSRISRVTEKDIGVKNKHLDVWHVGAGGAVTALSTPVGEREEMQTKASGTLRMFNS